MIVQYLYQTPHKIWRLQLDSHANHLVLEIRNEIDREVSFTAIDWQKGDIIWEEGTLEEPWWVHMAAVNQGKLLLHSLHDTQDPSPKGLICLDIESGEGLWEHEGYLLQYCYHNAMQCTKDNEPVVLDMNGDEIDISGQAIAEPSHQLPFRYLPSDAHFATVSSFLREKHQATAVGAIDYYQNDDLIIIAYYQINDIYFDNHLLILNKAGVLQYQAILNEGAKGIGTESFGVQGNWLFYIENKQKFCRINLSQA